MQSATVNQSYHMRTLKTICMAAALAVPVSLPAADSVLLGWNNLGMHCMDSDYSVFSILPPYNTIEAQLVVGGKLLKTNTGYSVTYEAIADPDGSINSTSAGKGNFYSFTAALYGALATDHGLAGWGMPGAANQPQSMLFENTNHPATGVAMRVDWFRAEGIPITPYDNAMKKNSYPMMRLVARNAAKAIIATNDIVLPVSDEMDCRACHASGSPVAARPAAGWVNDANPERDYRLNVLRLHDEKEFSLHSADYSAALATAGLNPEGLYANVASDGRPILCAGCHASEALGTASIGKIPSLTASIHSLHAGVMDPVLNMPMDSSANRAACYRCHPGSTTKCLRGAMGSAVAADGSMAMQCQSCHGSMTQVGAANRVGWFMEPNCQSCHTGTAKRNNGQIRYTSVFDASGNTRLPADTTFATTPNTPAAGISLYRFSVGHGGLQCSACHGSTHAEFPASHRNDNVRNIELQGHAGVLSECAVCHTTVPSTVNGGPHGMHPVGQSWVRQHHDSVESAGAAACQSCHGVDYRGTVLSRSQADRSLSAFGTQTFFRGAIIGCYTCHSGPSNDDANSSLAPVVSSVSASTWTGHSVSFTLPVSGANATLRIISQPAHGTAGLSNSTATYFPDSGFAGSDSFTFAAYDGSKNSILATATITVTTNPPVAPVITKAPAGVTVSPGATVVFSATATGTAPLRYQWFKNGASIPSATNTTLTLTAVTASSAGNYSVSVSNAAGSVLSATATLTVKTTPITVKLTSPAANASYAAPASVRLTASALPVASVAQVQFYDAGTLLGSASTTPFTITANLKAGVHVLTARAINGSGVTYTSPSVRVTVTQPAVVSRAARN